MDLGLRDKVAVVTGASAGIGLAIAHGLAAEGVHLVLSARDPARLSDAAANIGERHGVRIVSVAGDVGTADGAASLVVAAEREFGGADILINNAGTANNETIMKAPDERWQVYWNLHVVTAVRLARGLVPSMRRRGGGVILHNGSVCAGQPLWYEAIYNMTKAALVMFSKSLALEMIKDNIRFNAINPGLVLTPDWIRAAKQLSADKGGDWQGYLQGIAREHTLIERFASPEEIADFFVFMCSARASYLVGSTYFVDGGMSKAA